MANAANENKNKLDSFADDLDAMLGEIEPQQHVGMIEDDDDAIDRLLMGEDFQHIPLDANVDEFADFDALFGEDIIEKNQIPDLEDLDELEAVPDIDNSTHEQPTADLDEHLNTLEAENEWQEEASEQQAEAVESAESNADNIDIEAINEKLSDEMAKRKNTDTLLAEFDISPDDLSPDEPPKTSPSEQEPALAATEQMAEIDSSLLKTAGSEPTKPTSSLADVASSIAEKPAAEITAAAPHIEDFSVVDDAVDAALAVAAAGVVEIAAEKLAEQPELSSAPVPPLADAVSSTDLASPVSAAPDYSAELEALTSQLTQLNKQLVSIKQQHSTLKQELTGKASQEGLTACEDSVESLQTEQKKTKRIVDAVSNQKPISAYVANGLAVTALLLGLGLAIQGYIAKTHEAELLAMLGKLQEQITGAPGNEAADKEMLRKELDSLALADSVQSNEIAELKKLITESPSPVSANPSAPISSGAPVARLSGDAAKQIADLSAQTLQMGDAIEALETKVSNLEKNKGQPVLAAKKAEKKAPVIVEDNWAVNLIAFKQDWYAQRKAEEFNTKGVAAKVSRTDSKGEVWYRLSVDGFKSQYEAAAYAAKVKKSLNLDGVWVSKFSTTAEKN